MHVQHERPSFRGPTFRERPPFRHRAQAQGIYESRHERSPA